jgi:hypothetical protein
MATQTVSFGQSSISDVRAGQDRYIAIGNTTVDEANVFIFSSLTTDTLFRKITSCFINAHYRVKTKDIVLIPGVRSGISERTSLVVDLEKETKVYGWEPQNYEALFNTPYIQKKIETTQKLKAIKETLLKLQQPGSEAEEILDSLCKQFQKLSENNPETQQYLNPLITPSPQTGTTPLQQYYQDTQNSLNFIGMINPTLEFVENRIEQEFYKNLSLEDIEKIKMAKPFQIQSLANEIETRASSGKRLFIIAGPTLLLSNPYDKDAANPEAVQKSLANKKFVLITTSDVLKGVWAEANKNFLSSLHLLNLREIMPDYTEILATRHEQFV